MVEEVGTFGDHPLVGLGNTGHGEFPGLLDDLAADLVHPGIEELRGIGTVDRFAAAGYDHPLEVHKRFTRSTHPMAPDAPVSGYSPDSGDRPPPTVACRRGPMPRPELADDCWFLAGPTAAGKTSLGVRMAERLGAEIISVDSMAVYRGLDIGTAKPSLAERDRIPHHMIDVVEPAAAYNVALWLGGVAATLDDIRRRGRRILFVGGTPLYLRALRDGLADIPGEDPAIREQLRREVESTGSVALHGRLAEVDPRAAARIHPNDTKRIIRALEVAATSPLPLSASFAPAPHPVFRAQMMVVDLPRAFLHDRIDRRVEAMFAAGLVEETRAALEQPGGIGPTAGQATGYSEALAVIAGRLPIDAAIRLTQQRTRQLAKRQLTWLRSFADAVWIAA